MLGFRVYDVYHGCSSELTFNPRNEPLRLIERALRFQPPLVVPLKPVDLLRELLPLGLGGSVLDPLTERPYRTGATTEGGKDVTGGLEQRSDGYCAGLHHYRQCELP